MRTILIEYGTDATLFSLAASVGAGSAGCALANRLTADGTSSVLLLEAGGLEDAAAQVPFFSVLLQRTDVDWDYTTERQHNASLSVDDQTQPEQMVSIRCRIGVRALSVLHRLFMYWAPGEVRKFSAKLIN
ncbi:hypothetical protein HPB49_008487 [Dermacentor silvarum]|uniref:Uncharacterized protein n=1 Tax=Dermacentor silvarum TaxID=543639 RepID=A0ACB8DBU5_DERSI|nr:hypothetical protein HPB49_008487 [Dermacentor silvarum]